MYLKKLLLFWQKKHPIVRFVPLKIFTKLKFFLYKKIKKSDGINKEKINECVIYHQVGFEILKFEF